MISKAQKQENNSDESQTDFNWADKMKQGYCFQWEVRTNSSQQEGEDLIRTQNPNPMAILEGLATVARYSNETTTVSL